MIRLLPSRPAPRTSFRRSEDGAILVEFALVMPLMLLFVALILESGRIFWTYQMAVSGVRDATRYLARIAPVDACLPGGPGFAAAGYRDALQAIVDDDVDADGVSFFPSSVAVEVANPALDCVPGDYRTDPAPMASVTATLTVDLPLAGVLGLFGDAIPSTWTSSIVEEARVYGQ